MFVFLSGFVFVINLLLTVYLFPFWKITQPLTFLTIAFQLMDIAQPTKHTQNKVTKLSTSQSLEPL